MTSSMAIGQCLLVTVLAAGCKPTPESLVSDTKQDDTSIHLAKAQANVKTAVQAMGEYSYARKAELVATMKRDLLVLQEDLDHLSATIEGAGSGAKADAKNQLEQVRAKLAQTKSLLAEVESATESTWDGSTGGFRQAYADLRKSIEGTRKWLSDKMAP